MAITVKSIENFWKVVNFLKSLLKAIINKNPPIKEANDNEI
ncbi:hypothetical protein RD055328_09550 [Companilactobacillus sp. RD055328]|nr:hypothetical protein RD055328_09550 [Companilactobacillus sp. RD055328]